MKFAEVKKSLTGLSSSAGRLAGTSKKIIPATGLLRPKPLYLVMGCLVIACALAVWSTPETAAQRQKDRELTHPNAPPTPPGRRVALIIGNADYRHASPLRNPVNDAQDMRATLSSFGFEVLGKDNCSLTEMKQLIVDFGRRLNGSQNVGLFYYAGHGVQVDGRNYLIPVEANIQSEQQVEFDAIDVSRIIKEMNAAGNSINIVILDACRKNPFGRSWRTRSDGRSASDGLAPIDPPPGMLIAYATLPNMVADDGPGRNGMFTSELLRQLRTPALEVEELFRRVRKGVDVASGKRQIPHHTSSIVDDFYFLRDIKNLGSLPPPPRAREDIVISALAPKGLSLPASALRPFNYQTVSVNNRGSVISRSQKRANLYVENAGGVVLEMLEIPGGTFLMGTSHEEKELIIQEYARNLLEPDSSETSRAYARQRAAGWVKKEMPQHAVTVKSFFMGKYEITQAQWRAVSRLPISSIDLESDPSNFTGDNLPVEQISWEEANEFCRRLSKATGREYRLPSEAEWEYAARGGKTTQFPLGDTITTEMVNFMGGLPFGGALVGLERAKTTPVGSLHAANGFGLYDISGNVWEWCADNWHDSYVGAPADGTPWLTGNSSGDHVVRGGAWTDAASYCRSASRGRDGDYRRATERYGFRVVVSAR